MSIDTHDTGTIDLLDKATDDAALEISNLRQQLEPFASAGRRLRRLASLRRTSRG